MILVKPSFKLITSSINAEQLIENAGRTCYKSENKITKDSSSTFVKQIRKRGHLSVIEHATATVKFVIDRGVSHELVRHRLCSFSQESTRFVGYKSGVTFVIPPWVNVKTGEYSGETTYTRRQLPYASLQWFIAMLNAEAWYKHLLEAEWTPQQARSVLPNSLKTEIVVTANFREWNHIFDLRCSKAAHPQMQEIMIPVRNLFVNTWPSIFGNLDE